MFSKVLGIGLGKYVVFNDIDCYNDEFGKLKIDYEGFIVYVSILYIEYYVMS